MSSCLVSMTSMSTSRRVSTTEGSIDRRRSLEAVERRRSLEALRSSLHAGKMQGSPAAPPTPGSDQAPRDDSPCASDASRNSSRSSSIPSIPRRMPDLSLACSPPGSDTADDGAGVAFGGLGAGFRSPRGLRDSRIQLAPNKDELARSLLHNSPALEVFARIAATMGSPQPSSEQPSLSGSLYRAARRRAQEARNDEGEHEAMQAYRSRSPAEIKALYAPGLSSPSNLRASKHMWQFATQGSNRRGSAPARLLNCQFENLNTVCESHDV